LRRSYPNVAHCRSCRSVLALINSSPRTPGREKIAAVIHKALAAPGAATRKLRDEWDALVAQHRTATAKVCAVQQGMADESELYASDGALDDCAQRILADATCRPIRTPAALRLVADAAFWLRYDAHLAGGPVTDAVLAKGICATWEGVRNQGVVALFQAARKIA
jgi:hypothetical protein